MEPKEKTEVLEACRQYTDSKFRLRRIFPSLNTTAEIDYFASLIVDIASSNMSHDTSAATKPNRAKRQARVTMMAPTKARVHSGTAETTQNFLDRIAKLIGESRSGKQTPTAIVKGLVGQGWKFTPKTQGQTAIEFVFDTLTNHQDRFTRRGSGVFGVRKRDARPSKKAVQTSKKAVQTKYEVVPRSKLSQVGPNVPPVEVFNIIEKDFPNQEFSCRGIATKLNVHPYRLRGSLRLLHKKGFIVPKGKQGMKSRPWVLSPKSRKLNGSSAKAVAEVFPPVPAQAQAQA